VGAAIPTGLFDGSSVEAYLARALSTGARANDFRALAARATKLRVVAVALDSSELVAFGEPATAHVPIARAVRASMALPGLFCPVEIDGRHYIDGVARRTMHASVALREGARLVFCINPIVPVDVTPPAPGAADGADAAGDARGAAARPLVAYGLPAVLSQTFRTLVHSRLETGFKSYEHLYPDADLVLIEPRLADHRCSSPTSSASATGRASASTATRARAAGWRPTPSGWRRCSRVTGLALRREVLAESRTLYPERRAMARETRWP
jgi:predicted acylesterase/phospholipase RssA